jgi:hypothetical protein
VEQCIHTRLCDLLWNWLLWYRGVPRKITWHVLWGEQLMEDLRSSSPQHLLQTIESQHQFSKILGIFDFARSCLDPNFSSPQKVILCFWLEASLLFPFRQPQWQLQCKKVYDITFLQRLGWAFHRSCQCGRGCFLCHFNELEVYTTETTQSVTPQRLNLSQFGFLICSLF